MRYLRGLFLALACSAKILGITGTSLVVAFIFYWTGFTTSKVEIEASYETTRLLSPVRADGSIDYATALDDAMREGVTGENNAVPLLLAALGPDSVLAPAAVAQRLGFAALPERGDYFISMDDVFRAITDPVAAAEKPKFHGRAIDVARIERQVPEALRLKIRAAHAVAQANVAESSRAMTAQEAFGPRGNDAAAQPEPAAEPESPANLCERLMYEGMNGPWSKQSHPLLEAWLLVNASPVRLAGEASLRPRFYFPVMDGEGNSGASMRLLHLSYPPLGAVRGLAKAVVCRAMRSVHAGDLDAAWADLVAVHRLGRLVSQHPFVMSQLVALSLDATVDHALMSLAASECLPAPVARDWAARRRAMPAAMNNANAADLGERFLALDTLELMSRDLFHSHIHLDDDDNRGESNMLSRGVTHRIFDGSRAMRRCNAYFDAVALAYGSPDHPSLKQAMDAAWRGLEASDRSAGVREGNLGLSLALSSPGRRREIFTDSLSGIMMMPACQPHVVGSSGAMKDLAVVSLLLRAHRVECGAYPARLAELSGAGFTIPVDRFDLQPLRYRRTTAGYVLYSVGQNSVDDGGEEEMGQERMADIVMEVFAGRRVVKP